LWVIDKVVVSAGWFQVVVSRWWVGGWVLVHSGRNGWWWLGSYGWLLVSGLFGGVMVDCCVDRVVCLWLCSKCMWVSLSW